MAAGDRVKVTSDYTFGFGSDFTANTANSVVFYHNGGGTKVGIGVTAPTEVLDVNGTARLRTVPVQSAAALCLRPDGVLVSLGSSKRYKKNIRELEVTPEVVLKLKPVRFEWISSEQEDIGLIAEDVEQAIPDLVIYDKDGKPDAVKYDRVAIYLLELVRAQQEEIKTLKAKVEQLEAKH